MTVFIVFHGDVYECRNFDSAWDSREKADKRAAVLKDRVLREWHGWRGDLRRKGEPSDIFEVVEYPINHVKQNDWTTSWWVAPEDERP